MRTRTTIFLAIALLIAGIVAWLDVRSGPTLGDAANPAPADEVTPLLHFAPASVSQVTVQRGPFTVRLTRTERGWDGIGNPSSVDDFLRSLSELAQIMVVGREDAGPQDFGLDPPIAVVHLDGSGMTPIDLRFGNPNPTSTGVYARVGAEGPVVVTGALAQWELDKLVHAVQTPPAPASPVALHRSGVPIFG